MKLEELQENWDQFGKTDPLWAILTHPAKRFRKWGQDEFFRTGKEEIEGVMNKINLLKINFSKNKALDFGCGVGRLSQALCAYFNEVQGVDIAPSMIELANKYNKHKK